MYSSLARYGKSILKVIPKFEVELEVPIAFMGDVNVELNDRHELTEFMAREFGIQHHCFALPTTLRNSRTVHMFVRNMNTECMSLTRISVITDHC
jgi:hypothetical protein